MGNEFSSFTDLLPPDTLTVLLSSRLIGVHVGAEDVEDILSDLDLSVDDSFVAPFVIRFVALALEHLFSALENFIPAEDHNTSPDSQ